jgi:hypothetical protein
MKEKVRLEGKVDEEVRGKGLMEESRDLWRKVGTYGVVV